MGDQVNLKKNECSLCAEFDVCDSINYIDNTKCVSMSADEDLRAENRIKLFLKRRDKKSLEEVHDDEPVDTSSKTLSPSTRAEDLGSSEDKIC